MIMLFVVVYKLHKGYLIRYTVLDLLRVCSKVTWFCPSWLL